MSAMPTDGTATIRMVAEMVAYRKKVIDQLLTQFERGSARLHTEHCQARLEGRSQKLLAIADQIHGLAQDNAYDLRKLTVYLMHAPEEKVKTGHPGQVCYIQ